MLKARVLTALVLLAGFLGALFLLSPLGWLILCALVSAFAGWEWGGFAAFGPRARALFAAGLAALSLMLGNWLGLAQGVVADPLPLVVLYLASVLFWLLGVPAWLARKWPLHPPAVALATGLVVLIPPVLAMAHLRLIDPRLLLVAMAVVWVADIAAYFSGRAFGRRKLAPSISPGKTWAGAVGAGVGVLVFGHVVALLAGITPPLGWVAFAPLLVAYTALSIVGDLFESLLKRQAGIKDSGKLLPGHGGILDRIDSLTSTLPLAGLAALWLMR